MNTIEITGYNVKNCFMMNKVWRCLLNSRVVARVPWRSARSRGANKNVARYARSCSAGLRTWSTYWVSNQDLVFSSLFFHIFSRFAWDIFAVFTRHSSISWLGDSSDANEFAMRCSEAREHGWHKSQYDPGSTSPLGRVKDRCVPLD